MLQWLCCAEMCFSSDGSPVRSAQGRYTASSSSSEYEDTQLVQTQVCYSAHGESSEACC